MAGINPYIEAVCSTCGVELEFRPYDTENCDVQDARLQALGLTLCGHNVVCPTTEASFTDLITAKHFVVIKGVSGEKADPNQNEIDLSAYSCRARRVVTDYDETLNFEVLYLDTNWDFWNQIRGNSDILEEFFYVTKSGSANLLPSKPSIFCSKGATNNVEVIKGTVEWRTTQIEKPYAALSTVFGC